MTIGKGIGAIGGAVVGVIVAALFIHSLNFDVSGSGRTAAILLLALICSAFGAYIGSDDRGTTKTPPAP